jgi:hypothetical protein
VGWQALSYYFYSTDRGDPARAVAPLHLINKQPHIANNELRSALRS